MKTPWSFTRLMFETRPFSRRSNAPETEVSRSLGGLRRENGGGGGGRHGFFEGIALLDAVLDEAAEHLAVLDKALALLVFGIVGGDLGANLREQGLAGGQGFLPEENHGAFGRADRVGIGAGRPKLESLVGDLGGTAQLGGAVFAREGHQRLEGDVLGGEQGVKRRRAGGHVAVVEGKREIRRDLGGDPLGAL